MTKVGKVMVSLFFLTGVNKTELEDVWLKKLRFIARGFDIGNEFSLGSLP